MIAQFIVKLADLKLNNDYISKIPTILSFTLGEIIEILEGIYSLRVYNSIEAN